MADLAAFIASGITAAGTIAVAAIQRGAGAGLKELDKRVVEVEEKVKTLAGLPAEWAKTKADLTKFVNEQLVLAKQTIDGRVRAGMRQATGSHPVLPSVEDLKRDVGVPDLERRIRALEDARQGDIRDERDLQRQLGSIDAMLKMLLEGK